MVFEAGSEDDDTGKLNGVSADRGILSEDIAVCLTA